MTAAGFFEAVSFWHWLAAGGVLLILEVFVPGAVFVWMAVAAVITGGVVAVFPDLAWEIQLLAFAVLSVICIFAGRHFIARRPAETDHPTLNRRAEQYVGREFVLEKPVADGKGSLTIDDTTWTVTGEDITAGERVRVIAVEGLFLRVQRADAAGPSG